MKTGLFGGAFDPFHNGHRAICLAALNQLALDRLIVLPSGNAPHKKGFGADFEDRYRMACIALEGTGCTVSRYEGEREEISYSYTTVEHFSKLYPDDELYFIIGEDSFRDFESWRCPERIKELATLAVYPRPDTETAVLPPAVEFKAEELDVSSTVIRDKLREGKSIGELVPPGVEEYIAMHNLYK